MSNATPRGLVLLYHRIATPVSDPWALAVTPTHFAEHLQALRALGTTPVGLSELCTSLRQNQLADRSVAVTFDDGYLDNLVVAKPLLERHDVPATMFITTGALSQQRGYWWDVLDRVILQSTQLPRTLRLTIGEVEYRWESAQDSTVAAVAVSPHWRAWGQPDATDRHRLFRELYERLYPLREPARHAAEDALIAWAGVTPGGHDGTPRTISEGQLVELASGPLVEVGAHSVTHPQLAAAEPSQQQMEIETSKRHLERSLGRPVTSFAYPFGKRSDYSTDTVALVQRAGYSCACSNFPGVVTVDTDLYQLPRIYVFDCGGDEFAAQLDGWLSA